jgi:DNA-binding NarL/FixJ family response regulator
VPGGVGGKEVISKLLTIDPKVKAIVVSGYSNDPVLANYQEYGFKGRVAKPFNLVDLSVVLHSVLEGKQS